MKYFVTVEQTKTLATEMKNQRTVKWINGSIQDIEKDYGDLINPKYKSNYNIIVLI